METLQTWTFALSAVVIVAAVVAVIVFLFGIKQQTRAQYRVVIVLLFFALSCVTSILFAARADQNTFSGTFEGFSITVVGPAAVWLGALFLFFRWVPEDALYRNAGEDPQTIGAITKCIVELENRQGWHMYSRWKEDLRGYPTLFDRSETETLKNLLHTTYFTHDREKLNNPEIATAWMYFPKSVVKFQRIRGRKEGPAAWIRFGSNPTAESADATSVFLVGEGTADNRLSIALAFTDSDTVQYRGLQQVAYEPVDCLICTLYDDPSKEDYLLVDIKRFSQRNLGTVSIDVVSFGDKFAASSVWTIKQPMFTPDGEVPLAIQQANGAISSNGHNVKGNFGPWLDAIDRVMQGRQTAVKERVQSVLARIRDAVKEGSGSQVPFSSFGDLPKVCDVAAGHIHCSIPSTHDVTMLLARIE